MKKTKVLLCFVTVLSVCILPVTVCSVSANSREELIERADQKLNDALVLLSQFKGASSKNYERSYSFYDFPGLIVNAEKNIRVPHHVTDRVIEVNANELDEKTLTDLYYGIFRKEVADRLIASELTGVVKYEDKYYQINGWASTNDMSAIKFIYRDSSEGFIPQAVSAEVRGDDHILLSYNVLFDGDYHSPFNYAGKDGMTVEYEKVNGEWVITGGSLIELVFGEYFSDDPGSAPHTRDRADSLTVPFCAAFLCLAVCVSVIRKSYV